MKKLLDELEAGKKFTDEIFNDTPVGKALKEGFEAAYRIVRAHNPWHELTELPPKAVVGGIEKHYSIDAIMRNEYTTRIGFYHYEECEWQYDNGSDYNPDYIPFHWAYLPEVKP